ncbi:SRPBCC family protein [Chitinophaga agrisoli]|uniref:SRPBCC family protein n=1 Tax=Chitinophaga agrisoli TaxID=2607653 RepID=A0A5B2W2Y6_9BACT|nr:SRPBCC family protein [Chitinophaga agrisoli]KAA2245070.1 SRPBCC family protein [Chitinophaga agrisoli]
MKILRALLWIIGILIVVAVILLFAAPTKMHIERSVEINAPAPTVWEHIVKFEQFNKWNTWNKVDPGAQYSINGQDGTVGASSNWKGEKIGEGKLEHIALEPYKTIKQKLSFIKPWESSADVFFNLGGSDGKTTVTWGFDSEFPRPMNVMGLFMEGSLKKDYDDGLRELKRQAEADTVHYESSL